jgi:RPA family protein
MLRQPAKKVRISDVVDGKFFYGNRDGMKPSYIITSIGMKVSRVNLVGVVIDKFVSEDGNYAFLTIEDGTESIRAKVFKEKVDLIDGIEKGDTVLVIGKVKEYNGEKYINLEFVRKVDVNYEILRKLELAKELENWINFTERVRNDLKEMSEEEVKKKYELDDDMLQAIRGSKLEPDYKQKLLDIISKLDEGDGVEISKLFEVVSLPESTVEKILDELISEGSLYQPTPSKLKKI